MRQGSCTAAGCAQERQLSLQPAAAILRDRDRAAAGDKGQGTGTCWRCRAIRWGLATGELAWQQDAAWLSRGR